MRPKREAAKLLILDPANRVFLLRAEPPSGDHAYWIVPGGGVEVGESVGEAARRELWEETGASLALGPAVWRRNIVFTALDGVTKEQTETFFLVRSDAQFAWQPKVDLKDEAITAARWWTIEEIEASSGEIFHPEDLAERLRMLVADDS